MLSPKLSEIESLEKFENGKAIDILSATLNANK
jgi:hypothetical protein